MSGKSEALSAVFTIGVLAVQPPEHRMEASKIRKIRWWFGKGRDRIHQRRARMLRRAALTNVGLIVEEILAAAKLARRLEMAGGRLFGFFRAQPCAGLSGPPTFGPFIALNASDARGVVDAKTGDGCRPVPP